MDESRSQPEPGPAAIPDSLRRLAWLLDESIPLPGGFRVGIDGLIGLIPVVGDIFGAVLSGGLLTHAQRIGAPPSLLARMSLNIALETLVGLIPLIGDLFDFGFKSNSRNLRLLADWLERPERAGRESTLHLLLAGGALLVALLALVAGIVLAVAALISLFGV